MIITASLLGIQHKKDSVEKTPAGFLLYCSGKHLTEFLHLYLSHWPSLTKDLHVKHELIRINKLKMPDSKISKSKRFFLHCYIVWIIFCLLGTNKKRKSL